MHAGLSELPQLRSLWPGDVDAVLLQYEADPSALAASGNWSAGLDPPGRA